MLILHRTIFLTYITKSLGYKNWYLCGQAIGIDDHCRSLPNALFYSIQYIYFSFFVQKNQGYFQRTVQFSNKVGSSTLFSLFTRVLQKQQNLSYL